MLDELTREVAGTLAPDLELLDEVSHLVEEPHVIRGRFAKTYVDLPRAILVTAMRHHQKAFAVLDGEGAMSGHFLNVANMPDPEGIIAQGYERVLNARLADARFFWDEDRRKPLAARSAALADIIYLDKLGSYAEKTRRLESLGRALAAAVPAADEAALLQAARLAKCDLATELVGEFPELQGSAGGLLLEAEAAEPRVAQAVSEHYRPLGLEDRSPQSIEGALVGVADKVDALTGAFLIGSIPTGTRDPLGLRRAANGLVKTLVDHELDLDLGTLITQAAEAYARHPGLMVEGARLAELRSYLSERTAHVFASLGLGADVADAVLAVRPLQTLDALRRAQALDELGRRANLERLMTVAKRIRNIVGAERQARHEARLLVEPAERALGEEYEKRRATLKAALEAREYAGALESLAALAEPLHRFFEDVLVMCEDQALRANRIGLLGAIGNMLGTIADLSRLRPRHPGAPESGATG